MKIAIVNKHRDDSMGGSELQCDLLAKKLTEFGHQVVYIAPDGEQNEYNKPYEVIPCKRHADDISRSVIGQEPDILYWRFNRNEFYASVKPIRQHGIPVVFASSHVNDHKPWLIKKGAGLKQQAKFLIKNRLEFRAFKYVDGCTVNNREFLNRVSHSRKIYIPNGMVTDHVGFEWERPYCVWVANLKPPKRPELFIHLAEELDGNGVDFLMAGAIQDSDYEWVNERAKLPGNLYYIGARTFEEINGMMKNSMFHVHTCVPEGFPNIFLQAWRFGKPSVSYGYDPSGLIREHKLGFYSENNWNTFLNQVNSLMNDADLRTRLGENARKFSGDEFSIETSAKLLESFLKNVLSSVKSALG